MRSAHDEEKRDGEKDWITDGKDVRSQDSQGLALVTFDHLGRVQVPDVKVRIDGDQDVRNVRLCVCVTDEIEIGTQEAGMNAS